MQSLAGTTGVLLRRHTVVSIFSPPHRWWRPAFVRRDASLISTASAPSEGDPLHSRFVYEPMQDHTAPKIEKKGYATKASTMEGIRGGIVEEGPGDSMRGANKEVTDSKQTSRAIDEVTTSIPVASPAIILRKSSHRDGTIYKEKLHWKQNYSVDITDRNETRVEPMRYPVTSVCGPDPENCGYHMSCEMVQVFSLKLAKTRVTSGSVQLYGYIAARDDVDGMLNYVFHRTRDDPITVRQDSLIEMTGPKRGIALISDVLFEFDMRIKNGEREEDDLQLIDGATEFLEMHTPWTPFTVRFNGEYGAVDMCFVNVFNGVEATVELVVSEVQNGFDLSISSAVSILEVSKEFHLFCGTIDRPCGLRRFVIAVLLDTELHFEVQGESKRLQCC